MQSVDKCIETFPSFEPYRWSPKQHIRNDIFYASDFVFGFRRSLQGKDAVQRFVSNLDIDLVRNPVIGRSLVISSLYQNRNNVEECTKFFQSVLLLLKKVGSHLWHFTLDFSFKNISCIKLYIYVCTFLKLLPNLKTFELVGSSLKLDTENSKQQMKCVLDKNPLPHMSSLQILRLGKGFPLEFERTFFVAYGMCLKTLVLDDLFLRHGNLHEFVLSLTELKILNIDNLQLISNVLLKLAKNNVPLERFEGHEGKDINILRVLDLLSLFPIKEAVLLGADAVERIKIRESLSLRVLKVVDSRFLTYNFLRSLPNLEYLYIGMDSEYPKRYYTDKDVYAKTIHECLYYNDPPSEAFWKAFPNLKIIYVIKYMFNDAVPDYTYCRYDE